MKVPSSNYVVNMYKEYLEQFVRYRRLWIQDFCNEDLRMNTQKYAKLVDLMVRLKRSMESGSKGGSLR